MIYPARCFLCLFILALTACGKKTLFRNLPSSKTGITFNNLITENDSLNPLTELNIYNGGGVGAGDFNNDGLQDLYFTGNMVANKLYLNRGDLKFEDVTTISGVEGNGKWCKGISVVDINHDGKQDMYVSVSIEKDPIKRQNLLYINQGNNSDGVPVFRELAAEYGLNDTTHTTMANFFDYDNDGDLDVYLVVNVHLSHQNPNRFRPVVADGSHPSTGRLYRNDWNETLHHGVFVNVSGEAGIKIEGYGHGAVIADINEDGWKDIYVANDFVSNNILYINNHDGTFTDRSKEYFKNTAINAMGVDIQDINNDGLADVLELDMNPEDNYRKKMMMGANSYQTYQNFDQYKYQYQYVRNTLQLNQGRVVNQNDSIGIPAFSQIGFLSGLAETDWSWTPLITDFDHDGYRDVVITNGYPKDVTDHDFMVFRVQASKIASSEDILRQVPQVKLHNYGFRNNGDLTFKNVTVDWGLTTLNFSTGAAYADLDNDGDMEMIINNTNDEAIVYENTSGGNEENNWLNIKLSGSARNPQGLGTIVDIYYNEGHTQFYEYTPYRGYLSSIQNIAHFGLGNVEMVDSVVVIWPDHKKQVLTNVEAVQVLTVKHTEAAEQHSFEKDLVAASTLFTDITSAVQVKYLHDEPDFVDFNIQKLLPHKLSEYSPALAVADVDGDGLDDIVCGGNSHNSTTIFLQQPGGHFEERKLFVPDTMVSKPADAYSSYIGYEYKDSGILLFDADGDGDPDMYISGGGYAHKPNTSAYRDRFYVNDGKGNFSAGVESLPENFTSKFCVRAADYDKDGDLDLFVAGRVEPYNYPKPVSSFIFRNDSQNGKVKFTDVTRSVAKELENVGMICDALFTDFDNDGWQDLLIAGEWMPLTFFKNDKGVYRKLNESVGINDKIGWWNTIGAGDFDNDGDIDYVAGNLGRNSFYKASDKFPVFITAKDFDTNDSYDAFPSLFLPASHENPEMKEFPAHIRDDLNKQMISLRSKYTNYRSFAVATMDDIFPEQTRYGALRLKANYLSSAFVRNDGNGKFMITDLPVQAQISVLNGITVNDYDGDGNLDVLMNGNDYGTDVAVGRYDALNGLLMKGDGKGNFEPLSIMESGIFIPGNGKALVELRNSEGRLLISASQHRGPLKIFSARRNLKTVPLLYGDEYVELGFRDGRSRKEEIYYGDSFLSQSARFILIDTNTVSAQATDYKGNKRLISLN